MIPTSIFSPVQVAATAGEMAMDMLLAQPALIFGLGLLVLPWLALWALNGRLQPGALPHHVAKPAPEVALVAQPTTARPAPSSAVILPLKTKGFDSLENDALRALRRVTRERGSVTAREEARRKLLQLQSRVRFTESASRRGHEDELTRLLVEAARHGITVTPEDSQTAAA